MGYEDEKVKTLEVRYPDGSSWRIERSGDPSGGATGPGVSRGRRFRVR